METLRNVAKDFHTIVNGLQKSEIIYYNNLVEMHRTGMITPSERQVMWFYHHFLTHIKKIERLAKMMLDANPEHVDGKTILIFITDVVIEILAAQRLVLVSTPPRFVLYDIVKTLRTINNAIDGFRDVIGGNSKMLELLV